MQFKTIKVLNFYTNILKLYHKVKTNGLYSFYSEIHITFHSPSIS